MNGQEKEENVLSYFSAVIYATMNLSLFFFFFKLGEEYKTSMEASVSPPRGVALFT